MFLSIIRKTPSFFFKIYNYFFNNKVYVRFFLTGSLTLAIDLLFLFIFYKIANLSLLISTSLAFIMSFFVNFYFHKFWTFEDSGGETYGQLFKYFLLVFLNLVINAKLMHLMVYRFNIFYLLSQTILAMVIGLESFIVFNYVIFKKKIKILNEIGN